MISFDEAIGIVRSLDFSCGTERVAIAEAAGRVLAAPVLAKVDSPRSDVSAMDGYAVRDRDVNQLPATLPIIGTSYAGSGWHAEISPGTTIRVFTGAPMPAGADRVVIQENVRTSSDGATFVDLGRSSYVRARGSDFAVGDELLSPGRLLDPRAIVAAAGADVPFLEVFRRPRLRILSTGDELAEPGTARGREDAILDSVSFGVAALAMHKGAFVAGTTRLRDDLESMQAVAAASVQDADLVVVTGGASVGEKDFAKAMFEAIGLELLFATVAIKPGKPVWLGRAGRSLLLGLPGNPTSALVTARLFLAPLLAAMTGRAADEELRWRSVPLASSVGRCGDRETFHRGRWVDGAAEILEFQDSCAQRALAEADILIRQRAGTPELGPGTLVETLNF